MNDDFTEEEILETCENCNVTRPKTSGHIGMAKACKAHYGARFEEMKAVNHRERNERSRTKTGKKRRNEQDRKVYAKNSQKKKEYYQKIKKP